MPTNDISQHTRTNANSELVKHEVKIRILEQRLQNMVEAHDSLLTAHKQLRNAFYYLSTHFSMGPEEGLPETFVFPAPQLPRY